VSSSLLGQVGRKRHLSSYLSALKPAGVGWRNSPDRNAMRFGKILASLARMRHTKQKKATISNPPKNIVLLPRLLLKFVFARFS
jgi:hypothetical protein